MNLTLLILLSLSLLLPGSLAFAADEERNSDDDHGKLSNISTAEKDGLFLTLESDQLKYREGQPVMIKWAVENTSLEPITYMKRSTCDDGFSFIITDWNGDYTPKLRSSVLNIPEHDPSLAKFDDPQFYGQMLESAKDNIATKHGISIVTNNADRLEKMLIDDHDISRIKATSSTFLGVEISESEIPDIAKYDEVSRIRDGEVGVCGSAMLEGTLQPGQILEGGYSWSQMIAERENNTVKSINRISEGDYAATIGVHYISIDFHDDLSTSITIKLVPEDYSSGDSGNYNIKVDETPEPTADLQRQQQKEKEEEEDPVGSEQPITQSTENKAVQSIIQIKNELRSATENSQSELSAQEFVSVTKRLVEHEIVTMEDNIIEYDNDVNDDDNAADDKSALIPTWLTQNIMPWWTSEQISDDDFIHLVEWLLDNKVIRLD